MASFEMSVDIRMHYGPKFNAKFPLFSLLSDSNSQLIIVKALMPNGSKQISILTETVNPNLSRGGGKIRPPPVFPPPSQNGSRYQAETF